MNKVKVFGCVCVFASFMASKETDVVENRYIHESGRSIFDILDIFDKLSRNGCLIIVDIKKAFDSLDHEFLLVVLAGQFGYSNSSID